MRTRARRTHSDLSARVSNALASPTRTLDQRSRAGLEARLGGDLSTLRIHEGPTVDKAATALGARAFAVGREVALASNARPDTLLHEAAHALQQNMAVPTGRVPITPANAATELEARAAIRGAGGPVRGGYPLALARDLTSPGRLGEVHRGVRVEGPPRRTATGTTAPRRPWVDGPVSDTSSTAHLLYNQIYTFLDTRTFSQPSGSHTTSANLDADAVAMHQRVTTYFPQITSTLSDTEIQNRVSLFQPSVVAGDMDYLNDWMDNFIDQMSDSEDYQIDPANTNYRAMITQLINNSRVGPKILTLASGQSGFIRGEGTSREIFVHRSVTAARRRPTLIHEIIHLYRHQRYRDWVSASRDERHYNEGITEWLARRIMTSSERTTRSGYDDRIRTVQNQIAQHVSEDGIARAFFRGEVWRLETRSAEARSAFEAHTGIRESGTREEERTASRTGSGLFQTVVTGEHFRFLNLGNTEAEPKSEHEAAFRDVKTRHFDPNPSIRLRFVGHASGPGSESYNRNLSRRRSVAFYRMARREGVPWNRMIDARRPPHFGESRPTVTEEDVITRAMNRRVEMFLMGGGTP
jgi:hypothetical protein